VPGLVYLDYIEFLILELQKSALVAVHDLGVWPLLSPGIKLKPEDRNPKNLNPFSPKTKPEHVLWVAIAKIRTNFGFNRVVDHRYPNYPIRPKVHVPIVSFPLGHRLCRVRVCEGNKVTVLAETINHREDDELPTYAWKRLDEIKPNVRPDRCAHGQRQEQAGQV
jgi:hypothetical protein